MARKWVSAVDAAKELGVSPTRVRALITDGTLEAEKIGGRWLVTCDSVAERRHRPRLDGRPLAAHNAWALLLLACDQPPPEIPAMSLWRVRQMSKHGLGGLAARLARRATVRRLWAPPGELRHLVAFSDAVLTGSSASSSYNLGLLTNAVVDAYVPAAAVQPLTTEHDLQPCPLAESNVTMRVVPDRAWFLGARHVAPLSAVALDLTEYADPRCQRIGRQALTKLDAASQAAVG
jgi:hypothetical protein